MAADQERADRIRQLKADHPEIRWRMVADHVGVTERAAQEWQKSGGIEPANAKKLAQLFGVSYEWLWFGREMIEANGTTPDPFASQDRIAVLEEQLDRIEQKLDLILEALNLDQEPQDVDQVVPPLPATLGSLRDTPPNQKPAQGTQTSTGSQGRAQTP